MGDNDDRSAPPAQPESGPQAPEGDLTKAMGKRAFSGDVPMDQPFVSTADPRGGEAPPGTPPSPAQAATPPQDSGSGSGEKGEA